MVDAVIFFICLVSWYYIVIVLLFFGLWLKASVGKFGIKFGTFGLSDRSLRDSCCHFPVLVAEEMVKYNDYLYLL